MREGPTAELVDLLARLHLATGDKVQSVRRRARRLAGDLPLFDSVWIDALVQAKLLTRFQASEINTGRGERLRAGPFVIQRLFQRLGYADCFVAVEIESKRVVHLVVGRTAGPASGGTQEVQAGIMALQGIVERFAAVKSDAIVQLQSAGANGDVIWAAYTPTAGFPVIDWLACQGRLPPDAVLEIARQMAAALAVLEAAGIVRGELSASSLWLKEAGDVQLTHCSVRGMFRLDEQAADCEPSPQGLDYLSPERLSQQPAIASDLYSFGCLCWHLLTGRPPIAGGNFELKRQAVLQPRIAEVRTIAPDVSPLLAKIVDRCTQREPLQRPQSFAEIAEQLGRPTAVGRRRLSAALLGGGRSTLQTTWQWEARRTFEQIGKPALAAAACLMLLAAATYPLWKARQLPRELATAAVSVAGNSDSPAHAAQSSATQLASSISPARLGTTAGAVDRTVQHANYQTVAETPSQPSSPSTTRPAGPIVELSATSETLGATLRLQSGMLVRGTNEERPRVVAPPNGLIVAVDNVRFENVDFIWRHRPEEIVSPDRHAMIDLRAPHIQFVGCTFQAVSAGTFELPTAVRVSSSGQKSSLLPPASQIELERCVLQGVASGIEFLTSGPAAVTVKNSLYLGRGPLVRFPQSRPIDAPATINLENATLRNAQSVVELNCDHDADRAALLTITATGCVFVPDEHGALVVMAGERSTQPASGLLKSVEWSGQGSLISAGANVVLWQHAEISEPLPEADLSVDGLATSTLEFEGLATSDPASSRLRRWLGPIRSDEPPGIGENLPHVPALNASQ